MPGGLRVRSLVQVTWRLEVPARLAPATGVEDIATSEAQGSTSWRSSAPERATSTSAPPEPTTGWGPLGSTVQYRSDGAGGVPTVQRTSGTPFIVTVVSAGGAVLSRFTSTSPWTAG